MKNIDENILGAALVQDATELKQYIKSQYGLNENDLNDIVDGVTNNGDNEPSVGYFSKHNGKSTMYLSDTFTPVKFPVITRIDNDYTYNSDGSVIIKRSGWYKLTASITIDTTHNAPEISEVVLMINNYPVEGTRSFGKHLHSDYGIDTVIVHALFDANPNDSITICAREYNGDFLMTVPNSCSLDIERA